MKSFISTALLLLSIQCSLLKAQDLLSAIKQNAVPIENQDSLNDEVYRLLSKFPLIMMGELHGTAEPAKFITALAELFARKGDSVQVGFEIASEDMNEYLQSHSDNSIRTSRFFTRPDISGKASNAWMGSIRKLNSNGKVRLFFYDINAGEKANSRDSLMSLKVKKMIQGHPGWRTITLSGNVHNMLQPFHGERKMAMYLNSDIDLNLSGKICTIDHRYQSGTSFNNRGAGLELHAEDVGASEYSKATNYQNYLFLLPPQMSKRYTAIYFSKTVTASVPEGAGK